MSQELRRSFPVDWADDQFVSRREFFKFITLASGGFAVGSIALAALSKRPREEIFFEPLCIAQTSSIKPGSAVGFEFPRPNDLCILVRKSDGTFVAFARRCTHLSCPVNYEHERERLFCPCHNGAFSLDDGRVLQGPPPHPLPQVLIEIRDGEVWATGVKKASHA